MRDATSMHAQPPIDPSARRIAPISLPVANAGYARNKTQIDIAMVSHVILMDNGVISATVVI
jgi:hypothetical protein